MIASGTSTGAAAKAAEPIAAPAVAEAPAREVNALPMTGTPDAAPTALMLADVMAPPTVDAPAAVNAAPVAEPAVAPTAPAATVQAVLTVLGPVR